MTSKGPKLIATVVSGHTFTVDTRYELKDSKILGRGSYGVVTTATDRLQHGKIAIKRIRPFANDEWDARHTLREIRLLKLLGPHPNIITLYDLSLFEDKTELYMMMELMDCDLHQIIQSKQSLSDMHHKCFAKQMLEGIKAMHDIGVFHRDLKPGNILVSKDCKLRITDFGLARFVDEATAIGENSLNPLTEYVVTRWYRCPELLLAPNRPYNEAIDMWAVGCILAELLRRKPLFPGKSHANQVQLIFEVIGYSSSQNLGFEISTEASSFLEKRCRSRGQSLTSVIPQASTHALQLISRLLAVDPVLRPTASQALAFDYLKDAEILCDYDKQYLQRPPSTLFDFESEKYSLDQLRELIVGEVRLSAQLNMELRAKLGMEEDSNASESSGRPSQPSADASTISRTLSSNAPSLSQTSQAAALAGATTQRRLSSSDNKSKYSDPPRDQEGKALRRAGSEDRSHTTIVSDMTAQEAQLIRDQQMETNPTQQKTLARAMSAAANVIVIANQVDAVNLAKSTSNNNLANAGRPPISNGTESRSNSEKNNAEQHSASYGNVLSAASRGPKTPSPKKMDIIMQKGQRAKRLSQSGHSMGAADEEKMRSSDGGGRGAMDREEKGIASVDNRNAPPHNVNDASAGMNSSSFLKNRHFGFMRSASTSNTTTTTTSATNPSTLSRPVSAADNSLVSRDANAAAQNAGLSSLLSQFSGRYQSLSSKARSASNASLGATGPGNLDRPALTQEVLTKPGGFKTSRSSSVPNTHSQLSGY